MNGISINRQIAEDDRLADQFLKFALWMDSRPDASVEAEYRKLHELGLYYDEDFCIRVLDS